MTVTTSKEWASLAKQARMVAWCGARLQRLADQIRRGEMTATAIAQTLELVSIIKGYEVNYRMRWDKITSSYVPKSSRGLAGIEYNLRMRVSRVKQATRKGKYAKTGSINHPWVPKAKLYLVTSLKKYA